jgi:hypothetical protein
MTAPLVLGREPDASLSVTRGEDAVLALVARGDGAHLHDGSTGALRPGVGRGAGDLALGAGTTRRGVGRTAGSRRAEGNAGRTGAGRNRGSSGSSRLLAPVRVAQRESRFARRRGGHRRAGYNRADRPAWIGTGTGAGARLGVVAGNGCLLVSGCLDDLGTRVLKVDGIHVLGYCAAAAVVGPHHGRERLVPRGVRNTSADLDSSALHVVFTVANAVEPRPRHDGLA